MMELFTKKLNNRKGFTLIELIVVIAIIGILAAILIPQFGGFTDKAKKTEALVGAKSIATAQDSFYAEGSTASAISTAALKTLAGTANAPVISGSGFTYTVNGFSAGRTSTGTAVKAN